MVQENVLLRADNPAAQGCPTGFSVAATRSSFPGSAWLFFLRRGKSICRRLVVVFVSSTERKGSLMKIGNVLLCCALLGTLLVPCRATAQIQDSFFGGFDPSVPWTWNVPGNDPLNTEDPANYVFSPNSIDITAQGGSTYAGNNNAFNIPSLVVYAQPENWYVETAVSTDWSLASLDTYVHAGLVFFADADNYFSFYHNRDAFNSPAVQVSSTLEAAGNAQYGGISSGGWEPTQDFVKLRVEGTPTQVTFLFDHTGSWEVAGTVSSTAQPDVFAFVSSLVGKQVGLETDTGGGFNSSPFSFNTFKTNLVVARFEDDFLTGFNAAIPWTFEVPGDNPLSTEDSSHYAFSSNSLDITAQGGSTYAANNNAHNIPNLLILDQPENWYVETAVSTDWSMASLNTYVHAGLVFFADADNYFSFYNNRDAANQPRVQVSSTFEGAGSPRYGGISSGGWDPTQDYVRLLVKGTPTQVTFYFNRTGRWQVAGRVSSTQQPDVYALMSYLVGSRVGLETDTGGGFNNSPFSFNYFRTNLVVAP
jgi:hypothetical protein